MTPSSPSPCASFEVASNHCGPIEADLWALQMVLRRAPQTVHGRALRMDPRATFTDGSKVVTQASRDPKAIVEGSCPFKS